MGKTSPKRRWLRIAVLALASIEAVLLGGLIFLFLEEAASSDPLSRAIGGAAATLAAIPLVIFAAPALVLGVMGRWLKLALALAILAVVAALTIRAFM